MSCRGCTSLTFGPGSERTVLSEWTLHGAKGCTAVPNPDGTYTFVFATRCDPEHVNCIEVPTGPFDLAARRYLPRRDILSGDWTIARPVRTDTN